MYYEEMVIDGVLCWRGTPDGEWVQKTPEQLTTRIVELTTTMKRSDGAAMYASRLADLLGL